MSDPQTTPREGIPRSDIVDAFKRLTPLDQAIVRTLHAEGPDAPLLVEIARLRAEVAERDAHIARRGQELRGAYDASK